MSMMEYRVSYSIWAIMGTVWAMFFVFSASLILGQVNSIAGWSKNEILILTATETIFVGILWLFIFPNLIDFSELIRNGSLDLLLTKPLNKRFLVSVKRFQLENLIRITLLTAYIFFLCSSNHITINFINVMSFTGLIFLGLAIFYNIFFSITLLNIWFINIFNLEDFFHNILDMGRFPSQIYQGFIAQIFIFVIPVGYIATFPVQVLLGKFDPQNFIYAGLFVIITSIFSQWFWNFALKHYSSASS